MILSGFSFVHNAIIGGYPIREAIKAVQPFVEEVVVVDMESTDGTRDVLKSLGCKIIEGEWGHEAETTLGKAHALHTHCRGHAVIHFEADEVWDNTLLREVVRRLTNGERALSVWRTQLTENFQRIRWYPHAVHRVFEPGKATKDPARGHTTKEHDGVPRIGIEHGQIWDITNCFRDNYVGRVNQNFELWQDVKNLKRVPEHYLEPIKQMTEAEVETPTTMFQPRPPFLNIKRIRHHGETLGFQKLIFLPPHPRQIHKVSEIPSAMWRLM